MYPHYDVVGIALAWEQEHLTVPNVCWVGDVSFHPFLNNTTSFGLHFITPTFFKQDSHDGT